MRQLSLGSNDPSRRSAGAYFYDLLIVDRMGGAAR